MTGRDALLLVTLAVTSVGAVGACQGSSGSSPGAASANAAPAAAPPPTTPVAAAPAPPVSGVPLSVAAIGGSALGARSKVRGLFLGWTGPCRIEPPTRSAWMLGDGDGKDAACLYVDGPLPPGVSPGGPPGDPVWVRVEAELRGAGPDRWLVAKSTERDAP